MSDSKIGNKIVKQLLQSLTQFNRTQWHRSLPGFKPSEIMLILAIGEGAEHGGPGLKVSEISHMLRVTSPTVTQLLKELESKRLIERSSDPADRRVVRIRLTKEGMQIANKAKRKLLHSLEGLVEFLGEEDSKRLAQLLDKAFLYFDKGQDQ
ncbi:MarR family transcriptional regulator [Paenibacillus sp. 32O-W]|jgi:Transcriptional regulators|uniref:Transcriptional regulator n=1 Tax=Paenibacillus cisolokensis TaxID=1658519 RepID=A0ABQ4NAH4_9BACL|nr:MULTISPECIES: MarR family transcriptional regulator [Paenibacillus]ALS25961.1 MarR family transcriptional regulator [Paenibacillus sp. 32O-W]GIQ65172.1 transcriptional regulator [Paenibacillus cisolokensis]